MRSCRGRLAEQGPQRRGFRAAQRAASRGLVARPPTNRLRRGASARGGGGTVRWGPCRAFRRFTPRVPGPRGRGAASPRSHVARSPGAAPGAVRGLSPALPFRVLSHERRPLRRRQVLCAARLKLLQTPRPWAGSVSRSLQGTAAALRSSFLKFPFHFLHLM